MLASRERNSTEELWHRNGLWFASLLLNEVTTAAPIPTNKPSKHPVKARVQLPEGSGYSANTSLGSEVWRQGKVGATCCLTSHETAECGLLDVARIGYSNHTEDLSKVFDQTNQRNRAQGWLNSSGQICQQL